VQRLTSAKGLDIPAAWVHFDLNDVVLASGRGVALPMSLTIPAGARPGRYGSDLVVAAVGNGRVGTTALGAAAATGLEFTVATGRRAVALEGVTQWLLLAAAIVAGVGALAWGLNRFRFTVLIERR
jgi:hypothetical protein